MSQLRPIVRARAPTAQLYLDSETLYTWLTRLVDTWQFIRALKDFNLLVIAKSFTLKPYRRQRKKEEASTKI